jgi:SAM-dependent methyltransferase
MPRFDPILGLVAPELRWVPTPSHVIRRGAIFDALKRQRPGRTLEMGCGSGVFLCDLEKLGFTGRGVETSADALAMARQLWSQPEGAFTVSASLTNDDAGSYEYLMAFEVLEHLSDDRAMLRSWVRCLKPHGLLVFSVPAHRARFGSADEWAGHQRRYDFDDVVALAEAADCEVLATHCYGFPLLNLLQPLSNFAGRRKLHRKRREAQPTAAAEATAQSGIDRALESRVFWTYGNALSKQLFRLAWLVQRAFYGTRFGTGYIVVARKR